MRTSVPPWVARVGAGRGSGLAGPILAAFAAVLIAVSGMFVMQLASARSQLGASG